MKKALRFLLEHWGVLSLGCAGVSLFVGWCVAYCGGGLPGLSCIAPAVCAVCAVLLCAFELLGWADEVREMGGGGED